MTQDIKVKISNLTKIFGPKADSVLKHVDNGMGKDDLLKEHKHVLGLSNINLELANKNIEVIMGLSGSGKSTLIRHINRLIEPTAGSIMIGVAGLGLPVLQAVQNQFLSMGMLNGLAIVALAVIFDRVSQAFGTRIQKHRSGDVL